MVVIHQTNRESILVVSVGKVQAVIPSTALNVAAEFMLKCSGIKGSLAKVVNFKCKGCCGEITYVPTVEKVNLANCELQVVDKFCYLGDMIDASGGAESICRLQCGWKKFRDLLPLLTTKAVPLNVRGELYKTCVRPVMLYVMVTENISSGSYLGWNRVF